MISQKINVRLAEKLVVSPLGVHFCPSAFLEIDIKLVVNYHTKWYNYIINLKVITYMFVRPIIKFMFSLTNFFLKNVLGIGNVL
jgi:hypothetical protein